LDNKAEAARKLGISAQHPYEKLKKIADSHSPVVLAIVIDHDLDTPLKYENKNFPFGKGGSRGIFPCTSIPIFMITDINRCPFGTMFRIRDFITI